MIDDLRRAVRGRVVARGGLGYQAARRVWNGAIDVQPLAVVRCADASDARAALAFALERDLPVAVRGGGHSIAGHGTADGAVVIDLSALRTVTIDGAVATVGGGCRWSDLIAAGKGLATPGGFNPRVGIAGLTLGGGYGALSRALGLACDNLVGLEMITADGQLREIDEGDDLLWAARGAGANFGVATALRMKLHPVGPLYSSTLVYPLEASRELLLRYRDWVAGVPDAMTAYVGFDGRGAAFIQAIHVGEPSEGERLVTELTQALPPRSQHPAVVSYAELHAPHEDAFPDGNHNAWRAHFIAVLDDSTIGALSRHAALCQGTPLYFVLEHMGGAIARVRPDETAFPHRLAPYGIAIAVEWRPEAPAPRALELGESLYQALLPARTGVYANYLGAGHTADDVASAYGGNLFRLRALKRYFDPKNVFRSNVNIPPAESSTPP